MNERTYGRTSDCLGCRYWSEMIARAGGGTTNPSGAVEALCLNAASPKSGDYTVATDTCAVWASGHRGPIDDPGGTAADHHDRELTGRLDERCPDCGAPVVSIFDHITGCS